MWKTLLMPFLEASGCFASVRQWVSVSDLITRIAQAHKGTLSKKAGRISALFLSREQGLSHIWQCFHLSRRKSTLSLRMTMSKTCSKPP
jgi:hypothetical protein